MIILVQAQKVRRYGVFKFLFDVFMTVITYGFWLIWIYVREKRNSA